MGVFLAKNLSSPLFPPRINSEAQGMEERICVLESNYFTEPLLLLPSLFPVTLYQPDRLTQHRSQIERCLR